MGLFDFKPVGYDPGSLPPPIHHGTVTVPSDNNHFWTQIVEHDHRFDYKYNPYEIPRIDIQAFMQGSLKKEAPMPDMVYYWKDGEIQEWKIVKLDLKDIFFHLLEVSEGKNCSFILCATGAPRSLIGRCDVTFDPDFTKIHVTGGFDYSYYRKTNQDGDFWFIRVDESGKRINFWAGKAIYLGDQAFANNDGYENRRYGYIQIQEEGNPFDEKIIEIETGRYF